MGRVVGSRQPVLQQRSVALDGLSQVPRVCDVPIEHLGMVWPRIEEFVTKGLNDDGLGRYLPEDVLALLKKGQLKLWVAYDSKESVFDAAMVTDIVQYPQCRECMIWAVGGSNMKRWLAEWIATIEAYACAHGCIRLATRGRDGWIKAAGAKSVGVELVKPLWGAMT